MNAASAVCDSGCVSLTRYHNAPCKYTQHASLLHVYLTGPSDGKPMTRTCVSQEHSVVYECVAERWVVHSQTAMCFLSSSWACLHVGLQENYVFHNFWIRETFLGTYSIIKLIFTLCGVIVLCSSLTALPLFLMVVYGENQITTNILKQEIFTREIREATQTYTIVL